MLHCNFSNGQLKITFRELQNSKLKLHETLMSFRVGLKVTDLQVTVLYDIFTEVQNDFLFCENLQPNKLFKSLDDRCSKYEWEEKKKACSRLQMAFL